MSESIEKLAGEALLLAASIAKSNARLEILKQTLREAAANSERSLQRSVVIKGVDGQGDCVGEITVTFPQPQAELVGSFDLARVHALLGNDRFSIYFAQKTLLKKGALDALRERKSQGLADSVEEEVVFSSINIVEPTSRVGFRPIRS